jgi:hypothetical protein
MGQIIWRSITHRKSAGIQKVIGGFWTVNWRLQAESRFQLRLCPVLCEVALSSPNRKLGRIKRGPG